MSAGAQSAMIPWTPAPAQLTMAYSVCRGITRTSAKNFYYAFQVLPKRKRQALCAVYAFMRRCDDIADDPGLTVEERRYKLNNWLDALHRAQQGQPTDDPILLALTDAQRKYTIPAGLLDDLATGTAMDVVDAKAQNQIDEDEPLFATTAVPGLTLHYQTFEDLKLYCYRVASVVGLVCIHIFGYRDPAAEPLAEQCGLAFQLTNIIRDVKEDAAMGRVYLPQEDLAKFGLNAADLLFAPDAARLRPLLELEANRAREGYHAGDQLIPYVSEDSQPALWVLINIYRKLLEKIAASQYDVFTGKISLTVTEKLRVLGKGFLQRIT
ncbi:MAG TPA: phytoene/squalene synthase family protein [Candidatus Aquilonibacter sp.]|jgi:phytoene synthase|nr:phytoene/squalene synthase family protein [Candidatus Aquilonibacter sp.]